MTVSLSFHDTFHGIVFAQQRFTDNECRWPGNGGHFLLIMVPLNSSTSETGFCGSAFNEVRMSYRNTIAADTRGISEDPKLWSSWHCGVVTRLCIQTTYDHSINLVISPDSVVLTEDAFTLSVVCVRQPEDIMLTLVAPSMDPAIRIM